MKTQRLHNLDSSVAHRDRVLVRLMVPRNNDKTPAAAELFFAALHGTFESSSTAQPVMSFEIVSINKFIQFYFYAPRYLKDFIEGQLYAQYPAVEVSEAEDYTVKMLSDRCAVGADLKTTRADAFPIKTFQSFEVDPLSGLTSVLSQLSSEEELWIQICISPVSNAWQKRGVNYISAIRAGHDPHEPLWKTFAKGVWGFTKEAMKPPTEQKAPGAPPELSGPLQVALKGIEEKVTKLGFATAIRVVALAEDTAKAQQRLNGVVGAFKQFDQTQMNGFTQSHPIEGEPILELYRQRIIGAKPFTLNIEELASLYHLPGETVATPAMDWAGSRKGEPPQNLPLISEVPQEQISVLGKTNFRLEEKQFGIKMRDRALHCYAIGKTGTGKSTLLGNMIIDDINKGRGVAVVDPHGDLVRDVLDYIPEQRVKDIIYFSPADRGFPIGFNLLEAVNPEYKNIVASGIVGIFKKIFGESWGPRLEYILRNVILGLLECENVTMLSIIKILTDTKFRRGVIEKISDPVIRDFFLNEYERYDQKFRTEAIAPIQNKVGQFLSSSVIRNIVGQERSTIDIRKIMDEGKILLLDLSIGKIGEDNSALLGAMLITKIQMAAMSRAELEKGARVPFYLYVDEFQNFATDSFAVILSEARKYGLSLTVTNQYIAQMPETVSNAVFGNIGSLIVFRVGASDAESLQREFVPVFESADLTNLNNYNIYVKMAIDGVTSTPFSARTMLTDYKKTDFIEQIVEQSRSKYARPREEVEASIAKRSTVTPPPVLSGSGGGEKSVEKEADKEKREPLVAEEAPEESDLPKELSNVKRAEDYDTNQWYFLNRTDFGELESKLTGSQQVQKATEAGGEGEK